MSSRTIRYWKEERVEDFVVAPHRYTYDRDAPEDAFEVGNSRIRDWKAALPYQPGEVIYVDNGMGKALRAKILEIIVTYDRWGDRRPAYQCALETQKGVFSRLWTRYYPGHVQRGYRLAGLAPDLDNKD